MGFSFKIKPFKEVSHESMKLYCRALFDDIGERLLSPTCIQDFGNADKYTKVYFNSLFQMEKLEPIIGVQINSQLRSIRASLIFLQIFDPDNKADKIEGFISEVNRNKDFSHYHHALSYFNVLEIDANADKKKLITEFKANSLFF